MKTYLTKVSWEAPYPKQMESRIEASNPFRAAYFMRQIWKEANPRKRLKKIRLDVVEL